MRAVVVHVRVGFGLAVAAAVAAAGTPPHGCWWLAAR
jgi:hypothetical protein